MNSIYSVLWQSSERQRGGHKPERHAWPAILNWLDISVILTYIPPSCHVRITSSTQEHKTTCHIFTVKKIYEMVLIWLCVVVSPSFNFWTDCHKTLPQRRNIQFAAINRTKTRQVHELVRPEPHLIVPDLWNMRDSWKDNWAVKHTATRWQLMCVQD